MTSAETYPGSPRILALDTIDESVRRFLEGVISAPDQAVVEMNGHRLYFVVRPCVSESLDQTWTDEKNARRCTLIDREIEGTITNEEVVELHRLQLEMRRHVNKIAPLLIESARRLHDQLSQTAITDSGKADL